mmetsp:Transcript_8975/g.37035  ORF Transcript_8975/g.37035 Transcript_8975/m.37035 type:complete len:245 (+) Transcript_8975:49-783(+)
MGSMAVERTRMERTRSMAALLHQGLSEFEVEAVDLLKAVLQMAKAAGKPDVGAAMQRLLAVDDRLQGLISLLGEHQERQREIERLQEKIAAKDRAFSTLVGKLKDAEEALSGLVELGRVVTAPAPAEGEEVPVDYFGGAAKELYVDDVIRYSQHISNTTAQAPNERLAGIFHPPAPLVEHISRGLLFNLDPHATTDAAGHGDEEMEGDEHFGGAAAAAAAARVVQLDASTAGAAAEEDFDWDDF